MHAAAISPRGGVSPRNTRFRGQSIIEYVLIAAVIGLVVIFAGPQVSGAIRNQLNQVANTVDTGTDGDNFMSAEEKAYREAMKTVVNKEAKDWTLDEQQAAATDIAKNGTSSVVYAKAKAAMDAGTKWSVKLTNGATMQYQIIGINHDDLADGSGKAGLTFKSFGALSRSPFNSNKSIFGGWEKSEIRQRLNSGDLWNLLPTSFQSQIKPITKRTKMDAGTADSVTKATVDSLFLLSRSEIDGGGVDEGQQYRLYQDTPHLSMDSRAWTRSLDRWNVGRVYWEYYGAGSSGTPDNAQPIKPAFCF